MKWMVLVTVALCAAAIAAPAQSYSYPRSLEIALEDEVTDYLEDEFGFIYDDADYDCERVKFRTYDCEILVEATASHDITITDAYGDEVTVMEDDELECYLDAQARKRAAWSRLGRYRIALDDAECEVVSQ